MKCYLKLSFTFVYFRKSSAGQCSLLIDTSNAIDCISNAKNARKPLFAVSSQFLPILILFVVGFFVNLVEYAMQATFTRSLGGIFDKTGPFLMSYVK